MAVALTRAQVRAYRVAVHHLERPAGDPLREGVLSAGVQDYPPGRTAGLALRARGATVDPDSVTLVHSMRAAPHLHPTADLGWLTEALRLELAGDLAKEQFGPFGHELADQQIGFADAVDQVADAMRVASADGRGSTKAELSTAVNELVDLRLRPWCPGCGVHHVQDALFRYAALQAGLCIVVRPTGPFHTGPFHYVPLPAAADRPDPEQSRRTLVRRFLRLCGPARPEQLAKWLALTPAAARRLWQPLAGELAEVSVDGRRGWMHRDDLEELRAAPAATEVRLLPPYDPLTELADRELLLPDRAHRAAVWRSVANPGVLVVRGEIAGVWRQRAARQRLTVTIQPFGTLTAADQRAARDHAEALHEPSGLAVQTQLVP
ncbi:MAG: winged helix DNA-binding domain-containing protein [Micromonosporaceae bacterium]